MTRPAALTAPDLKTGPIRSISRGALRGPGRKVLGVCAIVVGWIAFQTMLPAATPPGIVLEGIVLGALSALLAVGVVLVYRANRILSFAQAELGALAAVSFVLLQAKAGLPWLLALFVGLLVAGCIGALVEVTVVRRFEQSSRLLPTVATIGVAQLLGATTLLLPYAFGKPPDVSDYRTPLSQWSFGVRPLRFDGNSALAIVVLVAVGAGLAIFLKQSRYGLGIRAAAENVERAVLAGVPTRRLSMLVWAIAGVLSGLSVVLQAPIVGFTFGALIGPALLLRGLAAAVIGRMQSLVVAILAAIALAVFEQAVYWAYGRTTIVDALLVVVILTGLLIQRRGITRAERGGAMRFEGVAPVRPIPRELSALPLVRWGKLAFGILMLGIAVGVPATLSVSRVSLLAVVAVYSITSLSLVPLTGWSGQISLGQFALVAVGAGAAGSLSAEAGADFVVSVFVGMFAGMLAAVVLGLPALRLSGFYLAVTTLAFAVGTHSWLLNEEWFVPDGVIDRPFLFKRIDLESEYAFYYVCLVAVLLVIIGLKGLRRSRVGRAMIAIRDNPEAAQAYGINATLAKLSAFVISGGVAGVAGALLVFQQHRLQSDQYLPIESLQAFSMAVIGGLGSVPGALAGAIYVRGAQDILRGGFSLLATGVGLTFVLLILPQGLGSLLYRARDAGLRFIARRRGIVVASLMEDRSHPLTHDPAGARSSPDVGGDGADLAPRLEEVKR